MLRVSAVPARTEVAIAGSGLAALTAYATLAEAAVAADVIDPRFRAVQDNVPYLVGYQVPIPGSKGQTPAKRADRPDHVPGLVPGTDSELQIVCATGSRAASATIGGVYGGRVRAIVNSKLTS